MLLDIWILSNLKLKQEKIQLCDNIYDKRIIDSKIKITNSKVKWINCKDIIFKNSIEFEGTEFEDTADFGGAFFCCKTSFKNSVFFHSRFPGAAFFKEAFFTGTEFKTIADFQKLISKHYIDFSNTRYGVEPNNFSRGLNFNGAKFFGEIKFNGAIINVYTDFNEVCFKNSAEFFSVNFIKEVSFKKSRFGKYTGFNGARFLAKANFSETNFKNNVTFMDAKFFKGADFNNVLFLGIASFMDTQFDGETLSFVDTVFSRPEDQELACLKAKNLFDDNGRKDDAAYHFYREMDGKRKQKPWYIRYPEFIFLQMIFGYGVHPWRLMYWWIVIFTIFANIYCFGNGIEGIEHWYDYIKISFAIAIAPGYIAAIINPASAGYKLLPIYQAVAIFETIIGTFLWAGFIATFAKKYMK